MKGLYNLVQNNESDIVNCSILNLWKNLEFESFLDW